MTLNRAFFKQLHDSMHKSQSALQTVQVVTFFYEQSILPTCTSKTLMYLIPKTIKCSHWSCLSLASLHIYPWQKVSALKGNENGCTAHFMNAVIVSIYSEPRKLIWYLQWPGSIANPRYVLALLRPNSENLCLDFRLCSLPLNGLIEIHDMMCHDTCTKYSDKTICMLSA